MSHFVPISEVQRLLSVSRATVNRLMERGELGRINIGRSVRIPTADVEAFLLRHRSAH